MSHSHLKEWRSQWNECHWQSLWRTSAAPMRMTYFSFDGDMSPVKSDLKEERIGMTQDWEVQDAGWSQCRPVMELTFMGSWSGSREGGTLLHLFLPPVYTFWLTGWGYPHSGCLWWLERDLWIPGPPWWHCLGWFRSSGLSKRECVTRAELDSLKTGGLWSFLSLTPVCGKDVNHQLLLQMPDTSTPPSLASIPLRW